MEINKEAYNAYVKEVTPVNPVWKNIIRAFVTGGIICTIGQVIINWLQSYGMDEKAAGAWNLLVLILGSIILTGFNLYPKSGEVLGHWCRLQGLQIRLYHQRLSIRQRAKCLELGVRYLRLQDR